MGDTRAGDGTAEDTARHTLRLATFNVHMGVDGWGRPYDLVAECAALDADVLVLQEAWTSDDGSPGTAAVVAARLGYEVVAEAPLARARLYAPLPTRSLRWAPAFRQVRKTFRLDLEKWKMPAGRAGAGPPTAAPGGWPCCPGSRAARLRSSVSASSVAIRRRERWCGAPPTSAAAR